MPHPLTEWLPNDAPWAMFTTAVLKKQCTIRKLPTTGHPKDLVQRLSAYSQAQTITSNIKRFHPWLTEPVDGESYVHAEEQAEYAKLQVVRVVDKPGHRGDSLRRDFEIFDDRLWHNHAWEKHKPVTVSVDTVIQCDCPRNGLCEHNIFIMRFVLNCPEPYLWQRALLPSELQTIYEHSHAIRAFGPHNWEIRIGLCVLCFRDYDRTLDVVYDCVECGGGMHSQCSFNPWRVRNPMKEDTCWICYEDVKWDIEKFCWSDRGLPAVPRTAHAVPARNESAVDTTRQLIQRKKPEDDVSKTSSSSSNKDSKERQLSNIQSANQRFPSILSSLPPSSSTSPALKSTVNEVVSYPVDRLRQGHRKSKIIPLKLLKEGAALSTFSPNNESTPVPGNPELVLQETQNTREQKQSEKDGHQATLPNLSLELGHVLPTLNPGGGHMEPSEVATAPHYARILAGDPTSARAFSSAIQALASPAVTTTAQHNQPGATSIPANNFSIAGGISQPPQVSNPTATATEPPSATGAQRTISDIHTDNPASASAPIPADHSTSAPSHAHSATYAGIDHVEAMELVLECSRLAKKSLEIREKSERDAKRIKKHRRELKKTKRKSKKESKRLAKRIESLEKEVLKALARPEVVEGATV